MQSRTGWHWNVGMLTLLAVGTANAQDACALFTRDEFQALTGKTEYTDPEVMPFGDADVCGFGHGQIMVWTDEDAGGGFDRLLSAFGMQDLQRTPVEGLGDGAFALFVDPAEEYQDHSSFVVFGVGKTTVAVAAYADQGEQAATALPQAMTIAQAIAAKLD